MQCVHAPPRPVLSLGPLSTPAPPRLVRALCFPLARPQPLLFPACSPLVFIHLSDLPRPLLHRPHPYRQAHHSQYRINYMLRSTRHATRRTSGTQHATRCTWHTVRRTGIRLAGPARVLRCVPLSQP